ncbi:metabolite traffic protein EboE [Actinomadura sp. HBU206391]|uniref:metabolite traffic protein EboE n=1 Tax=Actinomadura sp. HBU206391 TaxID=2731692 RepID=UPI0016501822|nr:metabolite traffic protein EboE [Actinomadura sp. HBU206391]MBC6458300.1 metabolite traffic protein EboE [Actinomadura sp. HBU206391]
MRLRHPDGSTVHLAYCANVHPADDLPGILDRLERYAMPVRKLLGVPRLSVGLWLPRPVAAALAADPEAVRPLRAALAAGGLEVVTLNGFPYEGFGDAVVKTAVYLPDWAAPERLSYTLDLARVLTELLPADVARGSVSTLPLGWRPWWDGGRADAARRHLDALAAGLARLEAETGRTVRVGLEPEPGCVVETTADAVEHLSGLDTDRVGVCLDACHLAVAFEDAGAAVARLGAAGLPIVKTQASVALHASAPGASRDALAAFAEPRYLHQTRALVADRVRGVDDLPDALDGAGRLPPGAPWRVHFHLPLHADPPHPLAGTRAELTGTLRALLAGPTARTDHVEVETYTWSVLPDDAVAAGRPAGSSAAAAEDRLIRGIAAELDWTRGELLKLGLAEEETP